MFILGRTYQSISAVLKTHTKYSISNIVKKRFCVRSAPTHQELPPYTEDNSGRPNLKPKSSLVLSTHLRQRGLPHWTSYFVKYRDITSDQRGLSHFNWQVDGENYHILRTGCWPYIKYHCTKRPHEDLQLENNIFRAIKVINFGIPCLAYGVAACFLISCEEKIVTPDGIRKHRLCPEKLSTSIMKQQYILKTAPEVWKCLKGVCCLYKPPRLSLHNVKSYINWNLAEELNKMKYFTSDHPGHEEINGPETSATRVQASKTCPDYTYHPLVLGDLYHRNDFSMFFMQSMPWFVSGICVMGIGEESCSTIKGLQDAQLMSTYTLEAKLGVATRDFYYTGVVLGVATRDFYYTGAPVERTSFDHVTVARLERALNKVQSHHQRKLVNQLGLPPNSQAAYEVLSKGLTRPHTSLEPVIQGIKVTEFARPHFCLEVTGVNLDGKFLLSLINDIGLIVRSSAHALQVRCIRQGPFTLDMSLVRKQWFAESIIKNINDCQPLVAKLEHEHVHLLSLSDYQEELRQAYQQKLLQKNELLPQAQEPLELLENNSTSKDHLEES
ncbi:Protein of unknown function DUF4528 [Trinorchestia longiramus]|nr:Protein of unknown function DUF4528 [Trinorchestia longiramus]